MMRVGIQTIKGALQITIFVILHGVVVTMVTMVRWQNVEANIRDTQRNHKK